MKVAVILPTYNERENIVKLIQEIKQYIKPLCAEQELIVVDDNSPDGTGEAVRAAFAGDPDIRAYVRTDARGLATAIRYGIDRCSGDLIVVMDTDFNHHPSMIPQMIEFSKYYDLIIGSRFTIGGGMENRGRNWGSFWYNFFIRQVLNTRVQDNLSGFLCIHHQALMRLDLNDIFYGYGDYFIRLVYWAVRHRLRILEIPVYYQNRLFGTSKTNLLKLLVSYTAAVLRLRLAVLFRTS